MEMWTTIFTRDSRSNRWLDGNSTKSYQWLDEPNHRTMVFRPCRAYNEAIQPTEKERTNMNETIGNRISKYRKAKGLTQEDLAVQVGVSSQTVSKWENDASCPDISLLPQLCRILGITSDELLTGKNNEVRMVPAAERKSLEELILRIYVNSADGDHVKVNIPMSLVKVCIELGVDVSAAGGSDAVKNLDLSKIVDLVERGAIGKLVEVESSDGAIVEVVVE